MCLGIDEVLYATKLLTDIMEPAVCEKMAMVCSGHPVHSVTTPNNPKTSRVPKLSLQDSDLIQLQLLHDNESLQMTRLLKEQEAKLMHEKKLHEKIEAGADASNEVEGAEDCMLL